MSILVINSGSSSIKAALFEDQSLERLLDIRVEGIGESHAELRTGDRVTATQCNDHLEALHAIFDTLSSSGQNVSTITAVGHRVLHGGEKLVEPTLITDEVERVIESMNELAPLHNPACLAGIRAARKVLNNCPHVAVFDTAFHSTLPTRARLYALSDEVTSTYQLRRFGFHGISHEYVSRAAADALGTTLKELRIISCHLGNGCSVTAVERGRSVETSMGMTPLEGLVMGSRSGDLDPGVVIQLMRKHVKSIDELDDLLNRQSGLLGMTGTNDMREIEQRAADGDETCRRAIHVSTHRARKYIGAYAAVMGGVDVILFTGGIGENSAFARHRIAQRFSFLGAILDEDRNRDAKLTAEQPVIDISAATSRVKLLVVATNEEAAIAKAVTETLSSSQKVKKSPYIPVAVSARHVHLTKETIQILFGRDHELTRDYLLSQPGQFASHETVTLVGPRNRIDDVRILGPARRKNQVEISRSDEFFLGVDAPVRASGDTDNTPGLTLIGPAGSVTLENGVICALRHIHMHPDDAIRFNVHNGDLVNVAVNGGNRDLTFSDVLIRVDEQFRLEMHIDTDEANAAGLQTHDIGTLIRLDDHARVIGRSHQ